MSDTSSSDLERLQGVWRSIRVETLGYSNADDPGKFMTFKGDCVSTPDNKVFRFRLDSSKEPKTIDVLDIETGEVQFHGIYTFKGKQLVMCINVPRSPRPQAFSASKDVTDYLTYYERVDD